MNRPQLKLIKPSLILFIVFVFSFSKDAKSQTQQFKPSSIIYYKSDRGPYWTRPQLDSFLQTKKNNRYKIIPRVAGKVQKEDTLIYQIDLVMDPAPVDGNNKILAGQKLPDFVFKDINGNKINSQNLRGKPVVINFWFTTCIPCIEEMPALNLLKQQYKNSDVVFLSMTFSDKITVQHFLQKHTFNFTAIPDAKNYCNHITSIYPVTLFVDRNGIIQSADHLMPSYDSGNNSGLDISGFAKNVDIILESVKK